MNDGAEPYEAVLIPMLRCAPQYALPPGKLVRDDGCISHRNSEESVIIQSRHKGDHKAPPKHAGQPAKENPTPPTQPTPPSK